jgi:hypothetical protein
MGQERTPFFFGLVALYKSLGDGQFWIGGLARSARRRLILHLGFL